MGYDPYRDDKIAQIVAERDALRAELIAEKAKTAAARERLDAVIVLLKGVIG